MNRYTVFSGKNTWEEHVYDRVAQQALGYKPTSKADAWAPADSLTGYCA